MPTVVLSAKSDVPAWNPVAAARFGDFSQLPPAQRNLLRQRFLDPGADSAHTAEGAGVDAADCDVLHEPEADQTVLVYSAAPAGTTTGSLESLRVTGLEQFRSPGAAEQ